MTYKNSMKQGDLIDSSISQDELTKLFTYPCDTCGDYEYCAGCYGTDDCTGYLRGDNILFGIGQTCDLG